MSMYVVKLSFPIRTYPTTYHHTFPPPPPTPTNQVWRIACRDYDPSLKEAKSLTPAIYERVGDLFRDRYGPHAGWYVDIYISKSIYLYIYIYTWLDGWVVGCVYVAARTPAGWCVICMGGCVHWVDWSIDRSSA